jgi:hypothetical protein
MHISVGVPVRTDAIILMNYRHRERNTDRKRENQGE